jgi:hypothetical protein
MPDDPDPTLVSDTITFMLEGNVSLDSFAEALIAFNKLVVGLSNEAGGAIEWTLDDLNYSSAITVVRGSSPAPGRVSKVIRDYVEVGRALQRNQPIKRSPSIARPAKTIRRIVQRGHGLRAVRFETAEAEAIIAPPAKQVATPLLPFASGYISTATSVADPIVAYGAVEGLVQTLTNRKGLRFTLYDSLNDRAVSCYLESGYENIMRDAWGRRAIVEGWITRDPSSGNPITIRHVTTVEIAEEGDYTKARAILPISAGDLSPEDAIRRSRDD